MDRPTREPDYIYHGNSLDRALEFWFDEMLCTDPLGFPDRPVVSMSVKDGKLIVEAAMGSYLKFHEPVQLAFREWVDRKIVGGSDE